MLADDPFAGNSLLQNAVSRVSGVEADRNLSSRSVFYPIAGLFGTEDIGRNVIDAIERVGIRDDLISVVIDSGVNDQSLRYPAFLQQVFSPGLRIDLVFAEQLSQ